MIKTTWSTLSISTLVTCSQDKYAKSRCSIPQSEQTTLAKLIHHGYSRMRRITTDYPRLSVAFVNIRGCFCSNLACFDLAHYGEQSLDKMFCVVLQFLGCAS